MLVNKSIRDKRNKLYDISRNLQILALYETKYEKGRKLKEQQTKAYKKWKFFDDYIKYMEKQGR